MRLISYLIVFFAGNLCGFVVLALCVAAKRKNEFFENIIQNRVFTPAPPGSMGSGGNKAA